LVAHGVSAGAPATDDRNLHHGDVASDVAVDEKLPDMTDIRAAGQQLRRTGVSSPGSTYKSTA